MSQASTEPTSLLSREAARGTFWNYMTFASGKLLNFLTTIILARLLVPEQFGLVGYCTIAIQYLDIMNTAGIDNALIARREKLEEASNAAFIVNICMGIFSFFAAWMFAPYIADFFKAEKVTEMFRLLAIVLPITGLGLVPDTLIQRSLRFRARLIPGIARNFIKGLTSIVLALNGWGPWSLVWGQIAGETIAVILSWSLIDWRPGWKFEWQVTKGMLGYGGHIIIIGFAGALHDNVDYMIVGRSLGATALGIYTLAYRIPELTIRSLNEVAARVLFPILSQTQSDVEALRTFYFSYIKYISLFTFSLGTGLAMVSGLFIDNFMSSKWEAAIIPMALISITMAIGSVGYAPGILYKAINRPEILTQIILVKLPFIIGLLLFCSRWGINGVAVGQVIFVIFSVSLDSFVVSRIIKFKLSELIKALAPAFISSCMMALTLTLINFIFVPSGWIGMGAVVFIGMFVYMAGIFLTSRDTAIQITSSLQTGFKAWFPHQVEA